MTDDCTLAMPSLSVKERIRAMEQRRAEDRDCAMPLFSVRTTKQIATQQPAPATLSDDDTESVFSSVTTETISSSTQYTSMTLRAGRLRKDRCHRRSQNKKKAAVKSSLVDEPSTCTEERDPQQEEPKDTVASKNADAKRDVDTDAPNSLSPDDSILDNVIDSLFEADANANQIRRFSSAGDEEGKIEEIVISMSNECNEANCISPMSKACSLDDDADESFPSFPFPENEEELDEWPSETIVMVEGRDEEEVEDDSRCSTSIFSSKKQNLLIDSACQFPPTPAAQIPRLSSPPALVRRTNIPEGRSKYEPVTPDVDADNARNGLPLPSATRAFLFLPTLEESPLETELQDDTNQEHQDIMSPDKLKSCDEPFTEDENEILEQILSENDSGSVVSCGSDDSDGPRDYGNDCIADAITSIIRRPSLDDDDGSECVSISSPTSLLGSFERWSSKPFDWKETHTCVLRY